MNRGREKTAQPSFVTFAFQQILFNCLKVVHEVVIDTPGHMKPTQRYKIAGARKCAHKHAHSCAREARGVFTHAIVIKPITLQAWTGPDGSRRSRHPYCLGKLLENNQL